MATVDIIARLKLAGEQFTREFGAKMDDVEKKAKASSSRINAAFGTIKALTPLAMVGVTTAIAAATPRALEYASSLGEVSQQLGVTTKDLQVYRYAATQVGVEQDAMDKGLSKLTQTMGKARTGGKAQIAVFEALGKVIGQDILKNARTAGDAIPLIAEALSKIRDPAQRAAAEVALFGKSGQQLDTLLAGGKGQIDNLREAAERLGLVLSDKQIQSADETADKLAEIKKVLEANIAKTVADNSGAILNFANSLSTMAVTLAKWWAQKPEEAMAVLGGLAGSRFGLPGAAIGAAAGYAVGTNQHEAADRANMDIGFRRRKLAEARTALRNAAPDLGDDEIVRFRTGGQKTRSQAREDLKREIELTKEATARALAAKLRPGTVTVPEEGTNLGAFNAAGGGSRARTGKTDAERAAEKAVRDQERLTAALQDTLKAQETSIHLAGMRALGLGKEADLEEDLANLRERYADDIAKAAPAEQAITPALADQLKLYEQQAAAVADLIAKGDDANVMTDQQKAALQGSLDALNDSGVAAAGLVKTSADQLALAEARLRAEHGITNAQEDQKTNSDKALENARARDRRAKDIRDRQARAAEEQQRIAEDQFQTLADFYEEALHGGTKNIWQAFKDEGKRAIAELAAKWTLALLSGQQVNFNNILGDLGSGGGRGGPFDVLRLLTGGGSKGGSGGVSVAKIGGGFDDFQEMPIGIVEGDQAPLPRMDNPMSGISGQAGAILGGIALGGFMGPAGTKILGMRGSKTGGTIGGGVGSAVGMAVGGPIGAAIGAAIGSMIVSAIGGALKKTKKGGASLGFDQYGELGVGGTFGNSGKRIDAASGGINSVADILNRVAEQLGGSLTGKPSVSLSVREGNWRLDPTGRGMTKIKNGAIDFGQDEEAAIRAAVSEALKDGVIAGISDASKRILASGQDIEKALTKAVLIEEIPKKLKARLDPVGAALDDLNARWDKTVAALREGGASAEQMADAQKLYKLELEETKASAGEASASLKTFLQSLNMGPSSPYSLTDQQQKAEAALKPFLESINSGQGIDQAKFQEAAQTYLDIERQLFGSTGKFFEAMDMVQAATGKAIATIDNAVPIRTASDPFAQKTADNTGAMASILDQHSALLVQIRDAIGGARAVNGGGGFIGRDAMYVRPA